MIQPVADLGLLPLWVDVESIDVLEFHILDLILVSLSVEDVGGILPVVVGHAVDFDSLRHDLALGQNLIGEHAVEEQGVAFSGWLTAELLLQIFPFVIRSLEE